MVLNGTATSDFTNLVIFCHKTAKGSLKFRKPVDADYLDSESRREYMMPKYEVNMGRADLGTGGEILSIKSPRAMKQMASWQSKSALGHWQVMRQVLPDRIWELW